LKFKLSFHDYKNIQRLNQKELSAWAESIYQSGYDDGRNADDVVDMDIIKKRIKAIKGIGDKLYKRICDELDREV